MECGGVGASTEVTEPRSRRALAGPATGGIFLVSRKLLFRHDRHRERHVDVSVQMQRHRVIAERAKWPVGQPNFAALHLEARLGAGFRDVAGTDRAEELAFGAGLGG